MARYNCNEEHVSNEWDDFDFDGIDDTDQDPVDTDLIELSDEDLHDLIEAALLKT